MPPHIELSWNTHLSHELAQPYFLSLWETVEKEYRSNTVYPAPELIFNAFAHTTFDAVTVVIIGQDPYHGEGQAHGLAFSVPDGQKIPPSLRNIYKEIAADTGTPIATSGNLERWAVQGVLLLNSTLTVREGEAGSHQRIGWETFTDAVIAKLSSEKNNLVFMLWGKYAQDKGAHIDTSKHLVLRAAHPSPLSAHNGFFGSGHFSQCNVYLTANHLPPIQWWETCTH